MHIFTRFTSFVAICSSLIVSSSIARAQPFSFGVVAGASLTEDFQSQTNGQILAYSIPKRWIVGAMVEARLPLHLSLELDGLYHELQFANAFIEPNGTLNSISPSPVVTWEFPLLAKYRFSLPVAKPFVEAGPSFRSAGNLNGTAPSSNGVAFGAGVETRLWKLSIAPTVRYTRWAEDRKVNPDAPFTAQNQVAILVGFSF